MGLKKTKEGADVTTQFTNSSSNLKSLSRRLDKTVEKFNKGEITMDQAKVIGRLCSDAIRAELAASMLDAQIIRLEEENNK